jgi:hypothetical protein
MQLLAREHAPTQVVAFAHARKHALVDSLLRGCQPLAGRDAYYFRDGFAATRNDDFFAAFHRFDIAREMLICVSETDLLFHGLSILALANTSL